MTPDELVTFAEELARIAAAGGGAKALASQLARRGHVGVLVEDAQWRHVAAAGNGLPNSVQPLLEDAAAPGYRRLRNGYAGRTLAIVAGDTRLGQLSIFGDNDLDELEHAARLAASSIAVELARELGAQPGKRRTFWERLASGNFGDAVVMRDDAAARGVAVATHYVAVAIEADSGDAPALRSTALEALRAAEGDCGALERGATLLLFVPASREVDASNARTAAALLPRTLAKKHVEVRVTGGVGTRVPALSLSQSIAEAESALIIARRLYGAGRVSAYDDLGAYPMLLSGGDAHTMTAFAQRILGPLRAYDEKHQTELERTLRLYFAVGENVKTAAAELHVHRHTVFYRLRQIGEICGCKLDDPHHQLTLRMALAIDALNG
ncbi:MAG TPA: helix-turn-helix domain-containing protein [Candidatus Rubrimentiphilum sp.]|nr:helix-turn-helix domain-containing protein [Candidatus Rubrimentiphilum sp.]